MSPLALYLCRDGTPTVILTWSISTSVIAITIDYYYHAYIHFDMNSLYFIDLSLNIPNYNWYMMLIRHTLILIELDALLLVFNHYCLHHSNQSCSYWIWHCVVFVCKLVIIFITGFRTISDLIYLGPDFSRFWDRSMFEVFFTSLFDNQNFNIIGFWQSMF